MCSSIKRILVSSHFISFHTVCVAMLFVYVCVFLMLVLLLYSCCCVFSHSFRYNETASTTPSPLPLSEIMLQSNLHFVYFYRQHNSRILVYAKYFSRFDNCERIVNLPFIFSSSFGTPISLYFSFSYSFNSMARLLSLPFSDNTLILYIIAMPCFLVCSAYGVMIPLAISTWTVLSSLHLFLLYNNVCDNFCFRCYFFLLFSVFVLHLTLFVSFVVLLVLFCPWSIRLFAFLSYRLLFFLYIQRCATKLYHSSYFTFSS